MLLPDRRRGCLQLVDGDAVIDVEFSRVLEEAIRKTGVERYRYLCLEHPDESTREGYRDLVRRIAAEGSTPGRPSVADSMALARAMKACQFRAVDLSCGCNGAKCALKRGALVGHRDCFDCLGKYDGSRADRDAEHAG